jgi:hypothetical protein
MSLLYEFPFARLPFRQEAAVFFFGDEREVVP